MPRLWDLLNKRSRDALRRAAGRRWRDPDARPVLDELPESETVREMVKAPKGRTAIL